MAGFGGKDRVGDPSNKDQAEVHALVGSRVRRARESATAIPSMQAAFRELLQGRGVYSDDVGRANLTSFFKTSLVSMPMSLEGCPFVDEAVPDDARQFWEQSYERMLKPTSQVEAEDAALGPVRPYWDPVFCYGTVGSTCRSCATS